MYSTGRGGSDSHRGRRSSSGGGSYHTKKKKARSDESLRGKTGISALYEWCNKRQRVPLFSHPPAPETSSVDHPSGRLFICTVALDNEPDVVLGRGQGSSKATAKHMAARRALAKLWPGVVFDGATGTLIELPDLSTKNTSRGREQQHHSCEADDLAPTLAMRLAIGRDDCAAANTEDVDETKAQPASAITSTFNASAATNRFRGPNEQQSKRKTLASSYAGTTTTSDDEEEQNQALETPGSAGVYSSLLFDLVQIDKRM